MQDLTAAVRFHSQRSITCVPIPLRPLETILLLEPLFTMEPASRNRNASYIPARSAVLLVMLLSYHILQKKSYKKICEHAQAHSQTIFYSGKSIEQTADLFRSFITETDLFHSFLTEFHECRMIHIVIERE